MVVHKSSIDIDLLYKIVKCLAPIPVMCVFYRADQTASESRLFQQEGRLCDVFLVFLMTKPALRRMETGCDDILGCMATQTQYKMYLIHAMLLSRERYYL